jgi:glutamate dehydrogenase (NADP+)
VQFIRKCRFFDIFILKLFAVSIFVFIFAIEIKKTVLLGLKNNQLNNINMIASKVIEDLKCRFPNEPEYIQAVSEVLGSIEEEYNKHPEFEKANLIERLCIPDRIVSFRVTWTDDQGKVRTNMGYRIQHNNAIGPYKGGVRFHASVNQSILKFLAFEQTFKNSLTTLPMGGAKGGSDFSPRGKSNAEVMRFCQAFMLELTRHIGPELDVPAGDIGVGGREVGFMFGMYKKLTRDFSGTFTGKGREFGGSLIRPEATGYGNIYFLKEMLKTRGLDLKGKKVLISGSGNVAQYTAEKVLQEGGIVMTMSDSDGYVYDPAGIDREKLDFIMELKNLYRGRIREYAEKFPGVKYVAGARPWGEKADIATPCATQNEINGEEAKMLLANGIFAVSEGANMPSTPEAIEAFQAAKILYCPGKASNAGGVSVSGLEMSQNAQHLSWTAAEVDAKLLQIMQSIHSDCVKYGTEPDGYINYVKGANIAGFMKVAKAMMAQGLV